MIHYIHCHQGYDPCKGGTVGYISSLLQGMNENNNFTTKHGISNAFIIPSISPAERLKNIKLYDVVGDPIKFSDVYTVPQYFDKEYIKNLQSWFHEILPISEFMKINPNKICSIHIHGSYNFLPIYNALKILGIENKVVKILTTHNPWKPEIESVELLKRSSITEHQLEQQKYFLDRRDIFAFNHADAYIFPTKFSMEGYYESWPEFGKIIENKKTYFVVTGTKLKESTVPRAIMRSTLNIPDNAFVFLYIGRFIKVRGYDVLIEAAKKILLKRCDIYFVVVGENKPSKSVNHVNWIEIPYTNEPENFMKMADAILCPNRGSYFDLSMIEALSVGTPLLAARVGGYKYLNGKTSGVLYYDVESIEGMIETIELFTALDCDKRCRMTEENKKLYAENLTPSIFASNYLDVIDNIYDDFEIKEPNRNLVRIPIYLESACPLGVNREAGKKNLGVTPHQIVNKGTDLTAEERKWLKLYRSPKLYFIDLFKNIWKKTKEFKLQK